MLNTHDSNKNYQYEYTLTKNCVYQDNDFLFTIAYSFDQKVGDRNTFKTNLDTLPQVDGEIYGFTRDRLMTLIDLDY